jgi:hypothetical protein
LHTSKIPPPVSGGGLGVVKRNSPGPDLRRQ